MEVYLHINPFSEPFVEGFTTYTYKDKTYYYPNIEKYKQEQYMICMSLCMNPEDFNKYENYFLNYFKKYEKIYQ